MTHSYKWLLTLTAGLLAIFSVSAAQPSGSLPVMTINTENSAPIVDKENYIAGTYAIDPKGDESVEALSGQLLIRGRGNWTWSGFEKKPYRLKLDKKAALLGYNKSKHFVLLAHADDNLGFMREPLGFKMSELAGMAWTPGQKPVEVILNGDYIGLYFLVENIKIASDRVNIFDQEDEDPSTDVTGGWLCEIDNYDEDPSEQIKITEGNGEIIRITHKSPEIATPEQEKFLRDQMIAIDKAFYIQDPASREFENLVDLNSIAAFYVIQELMDGCESFHGSCYLHRDRGDDKKWVWGPVWDFGNTYARSGDKLIYESSPFGQTWIDQVAKFNSFKDAVKSRFEDFLKNDYAQVKKYIADYSASLVSAAEADARRWPQYGNPDIVNRAKRILYNLDARVSFLAGKWGVTLPGRSGIYLRGDFNDWAAMIAWEFEQPVNNVYVFNGGDFSGRFKIADNDWQAHNWGTVEVNAEIPLDTPVEMIHGGESKDMVATPGFKQAIFTIIEPGKKATIELSTKESGIGAVTVAETGVKVVGNSIVTDLPASVYDLSGRRLGAGVTTLSVAPGVYIVNNGIKTTKVIVR